MKQKTVKGIVLDFVEANGPQSYKKLKEVVLIAAGQPLSRNEYGSSYLDQVSNGSACNPSLRYGNRFLVQMEDGLYHLMKWDGIGKVSAIN